MKNITILSSTLLLFLSISTFAQKSQQEVIRVIDEIASKIQYGNISAELKELKAITTANDDDIQISAVANALAGKALSKKNFHKEAFPFLEKAYQYRAQQGQPIPQKWAIVALLDNGNARKDYKTVAKYAEKWIKLIEEHENIVNKHLTIDAEFELILNRVAPTSITSKDFWAERSQDRVYQKRYKIGDQLINTCLEKYPKFNTYFFNLFPDNRINYYGYLIRFALKADNVRQARYWEKKALKTIKPHRSLSDYTWHLRYITALYIKTEGYGQKPKLSKYEKEGIRVMKEYIKLNKELEAYNYVTFGYRYLSKRARLVNDYSTSIQYLAEAIKYCRKYSLRELYIERSINGLYPIINKIKQEKDKKSFNICKNWKKGFSTKGLEQADIDKFDEIINSASPFFE